MAKNPGNSRAGAATGFRLSAKQHQQQADLIRQAAGPAELAAEHEMLARMANSKNSHKS